MIAPSAELAKGHRSGTHRLVPPQATLQRVAPQLNAMEITRCADITGLDRLGIPVFCAVRPRGHILQTSNGKGLHPLDARVSALMEAVEHFHAETPLAGSVRASLQQMTAAGRRAVRPERLTGFRDDVFYDERFVLDWLPGQELQEGGEAWLPASAVSLAYAPMPFRFSTNGLASGNHPIEASLHALYELIERDAITSLSQAGRIQVRPPRCRFVRLETIREPAVASLVDKVRAAELRLLLVAVQARVAVPTFWAVLLDPRSPATHTLVNVGYGSHLSAAVAAVRAITEAAQSRLTYIHGAREDLAFKMNSDPAESVRALYRFFADAPPADLAWDAILSEDAADLMADHHRVLGLLRESGVAQAFQVDLTRAPFGIPVVKVFAPGLVQNRRFF
jgi:ribosomal protein S12 methylthiotransferase accessory factor